MPAKPADLRRIKADARIRTADPFITSEVLYQLSYVGSEQEDSARRCTSNEQAPIKQNPCLLRALPNRSAWHQPDGQNVRRRTR